MLQGLRMCQVLETPRPQVAYNCRSVSTITVTAHSPPTETTHLSVAAWSECETAIKDISGCLLDRWASWRKVFSATYGINISHQDSLRAAKWCATTHKDNRNGGGKWSPRACHLGEGTVIWATTARWSLCSVQELFRASEVISKTRALVETS